jgi:hypothetical protein
MTVHDCTSSGSLREPHDKGLVRVHDCIGSGSLREPHGRGLVIVQTVYAVAA